MDAGKVLARVSVTSILRTSPGARSASRKLRPAARPCVAAFAASSATTWVPVSATPYGTS